MSSGGTTMESNPGSLTALSTPLAISGWTILAVVGVGLGGLVLLVCCRKSRKTPDDNLNDPIFFRDRSYQDIETGVVSVGPPYDVIEYSMTQWRGDTPMSTKYKQGYKEVCDTYGFNLIRVIRGDNYCAIRSTCYQALAHAHTRQAIRNTIGNERHVIHRLHLFKEGVHGLDKWSFANNLGHVRVYEKAQDCIKMLFRLMDSLNASKDCVRTLDSYLAAAPYNDAEIMEAAKILMMLTFIDLFDLHNRGEEVPGMLSVLFYRDSSQNPAEFFKNHLDKVGNDAGLEQIEMRLLSHTLGIEIRAFRMIQFGQSDFMTTYSETPGLPHVNIISEDDRHYNIIVK